MVLFLGFTCVSVCLLLLAKLNFLFVCAQIIFSVPAASLRQEFGKRILRGTGFLLETVCFDCK